MFLTPAQVEELTGYRQHSAQIKWLTLKGITCYRRRDGRPVVPISAMMVPGGPPGVQPEDERPDFSSLRRINHGKAKKC